MVAVIAIPLAGLPVRSIHGAENLADTFDRADLAGSPIAWKCVGDWEIENGVLINRPGLTAMWPHHHVWFAAPDPLPLGQVVRVDAIHDARIFRGGYLGLTASDSESGAHVEWNSLCDGYDVHYRTSDTAPAMNPLPQPRTWVEGRFATYAFRWHGYDDATGKGRVELLYTPESKPTRDLDSVGMVEVKDLRKLDRFALVLNAERQRLAARNVAFDDFRFEVTDAPAMPTRLRIEKAGEGGMQLSWNVSSPDAVLILSRAMGRHGAWQEHARLSPGTTSYTDAERRPSVLCRYRLCAESEKGRSSWTAEVSAIAPGPPAAPTGLRTLAKPTGLVLIDWDDDGETEERFVIERRTTESAPWQPWRTMPADAVWASDFLPDGSVFRYRVCAKGELGVSDWSNEAVAARPPHAPTIVAPRGRIIVHREADLPVASVDITFSEPIRTNAPLSATDFTIAAVKHPWHSIEVPSPRIASVDYDAAQRRARLIFDPPIPDRIEYRIGLTSTITNETGSAVAAPLVRIAVLLGDEDGDGFVAPAPGERLGKRLAMPPMPVGIMGEDIEWRRHQNWNNVDHIVKLMDEYKGIDFFRINLWWDCLEPEEGRFDPEYIGFLRHLLSEAEKRQLPIEIGIRQANWPLWLCEHKGFSPRLYEPEVTAKFAETWRRVATVCHEYPVVFGYWPISEEYPDRKSIEDYVNCVNTVAKALRAVHPGCVVKPRPAWACMQGGYDVTPSVTQRGTQDVCMAATVYPTSGSWTIQNPNPLSILSFNNMECIRYYSSEVQGGPNGLGEVGFRVPPGADFGDEERLLGFERCMAIAYDVGLVEYVIWGEAWTFSDAAKYFPMLQSFRDALIERPRHAAFDLCLVKDQGVDFGHPYSGEKPEHDLSPVFQWLEGHGYKFFLTVPEAMRIQKGEFNASFHLSDLNGLPPSVQIARLRRALAGVEPTGVVLPWVGELRPHSVTGLTCEVDFGPVDVETPCDAATVSRNRLQVYAPTGSRYHWRRDVRTDAWTSGRTSADSRITIADLNER